MFEAFKSLFSMDTSEISGAQTAFILIGIVVVIAVFAVITFLCFKMEQTSGKPSFTAVKVIMIAAAPTVFSVLAIFDIEVPFLWFGIITAVMGIAVIIWNILTYGIFGGLLFSFVHAVIGLIAGLGVAAVIMVGVVGLVCYFFFGNDGGTSENSSSAPEYVRNSSTGETFEVEKGVNGQLYISGTSNVLRPSDYTGHYIDSYGNYYVGC